MSHTDRIKMFLCGDVMTGRGIDQILPFPGSPVLHEPYMKDARGYVELAEEMNGPIPRPVDFRYIWGDALRRIDREAPDARVINLETSITTSEDYWKEKGINYRMHPANISCLTAAGVDVCSLANNHVLDWGYDGLHETIAILKASGIRAAGAGRDSGEAGTPAVKDIPKKGRVLVFAFATESSGVPRSWGASKDRAGINVLDGLSGNAVESIAKSVAREKLKGDVVVLSIHWGPNWGYEIAREQSRFAHDLIDRASVDVIHGHSSHHVKGIEVYKEKLILYGCGDLLSDYEEFRGSLGLLYFPTIDPLTGRLLRLRMDATATRRFSLTAAGKDDVLWLLDVLNREGRALGTTVTLAGDGGLDLKWK